jgi:hypothetical protein
MYQSLIWPKMLGHETSGLAAALDTEDLKGAADALVHRVWRDFECRGDLLGGKMLVYQAQAIELARAQAHDPRGHVLIPSTIAIAAPVGQVPSPIRLLPDPTRARVQGLA